MTEGLEPVVEVVAEVVVASTTEIVKSVLMTIVSGLGVYLSGKQAYTGIMSRIGK